MTVLVALPRASVAFDMLYGGKCLRDYRSQASRRETARRVTWLLTSAFNHPCR